MSVARPARDDALQLTVQCVNAHAYNCTGPLADGERLACCLRSAAAVGQFTTYDDARVLYPPHGVTAVLFLSESHFLISTWPEARFALVEIVACGSDVDAHAAWQMLAATLCPGSATVTQSKAEVGGTAPMQSG